MGNLQFNFQARLFVTLLFLAMISHTSLAQYNVKAARVNYPLLEKIVQPNKAELQLQLDSYIDSLNTTLSGKERTRDLENYTNNLIALKKQELFYKTYRLNELITTIAKTKDCDVAFLMSADDEFIGFLFVPNREIQFKLLANNCAAEYMKNAQEKVDDETLYYSCLKAIFDRMLPESTDITERVTEILNK
ncbi:hypothetical protein [Gilvibacter sp.]|uniref:hypothetical protein n=1 Tax=Gilvibacter sp. TaxID=2729997 RepID=UPI0035BE869F